MQLYKEPSWENAGWAAVGLASDLLGAGILRGVKAAAKGVKAARRAEKAAKSALNAHKTKWANISARSISEEQDRLWKAAKQAEWEANRQSTINFINKVDAYPVSVGWTANDAALNNMQQNSMSKK